MKFLLRPAMCPLSNLDIEVSAHKLSLFPSGIRIKLVRLLFTTMKNRPSVSVVMAVYNAREFVRDAVASILNQTFSDFELIIVDDGSSDGSRGILKELGRSDFRIKLFFLRKNYGPCHAANVGIKHAKGAYLARMDADDIAFPNRLEKQVKFLEKHPEVAMVGGQCKLINREGEITGEKRFSGENDAIVKSLFSRNPIQHPACMINLKKMRKSAMLNDGKSVLAHDLELVFLASRCGKLANLKDFVLKYRQHPESFSLKNPKKTFLATLVVRLESILKYGYRPTPKGAVTTLAQAIFVALVPSGWIYPVYSYIRGMRKIGLRGDKISYALAKA